MAETIMSGFSGFSNMAGMGIAIIWFIVAMFGALILTAVVILMVAKLKEIPVYEIDMVTKRIRKLVAREKRYKSGQKLLFIGKIKKWMPQIQQQDKLIQGKKDALLLLKDNNGLHHAAKIPSLNEFKQWHKTMYGMTYEQLVKQPNPGADVLNVVDSVYLLPNPKEDLEWLADQAVQANKEFATEWWKNPVIMWIGTMFICAMTWIVTIVMANR